MIGTGVWRFLESLSSLGDPVIRVSPPCEPRHSSVRSPPPMVGQRIRSRNAGGLQDLHMNDLHSGYLNLRSAVMSNYERRRRDPKLGVTSGSTPAEDLAGAASVPPLPAASSSGWPVSATTVGQACRPRVRAITVIHEAGSVRGRCTGGFGDWIVRRHWHVGLGIGCATRGRQQLPRASWIRRTRFERTIRAGRRRIVGHGRERSQVELHPDDVSGSGGDG